MKDVLLAAGTAVALALLSGFASDHGRGAALRAQSAAQNPCPVFARFDSLSAQQRPARPQLGKTAEDTDFGPGNALLDVLWSHRAAGSASLLPLGGALSGAATDIGEIAMVQDEGDLVTAPNRFDLQLSGLRFAPRPTGGYAVTRISPDFSPELGRRVTLADDDSLEERLPFAFTYFGRTWSSAFVNSDGNITFGDGDRLSTQRSVSRFLTDDPRVAPFFADLDPSFGGAVFVRAGPDTFTATWCSVPVFGSPRQVTMQASLWPDGTVEMKYASPWTATEGVIGISPGHTDAMSPLDLSTSTGRAPLGGSGAIGERFSERADLDLAFVARKFYKTHADTYDQLVIWTDARLATVGFAFESNVTNDIAGIGLDRYDRSREFGSAGRLRSIAMMDDIAKYPDDPTEPFLGTNNTLSILGQEVGHRWLAHLRFSDHNHRDSDALLGRGKAHWSFFFNSDASVMEGNRIEDLGGGSFRTVAAVEQYSLLDQYAMGFVRDVDVPPFFYVENPVNVDGDRRAESAPAPGVRFNGTRRDVLINDVVEVMGPRVPPAEASAKVHRQAFVFVAGKGKPASLSTVAKLDRIRTLWESFFARATAGRGRVETRLRVSIGV